MTEKNTNNGPQIESRIGGLEASFKSLREDNSELKHEMGRVWETLAGLRNDFATITHQLQNSISDAMLSFNEKRIEDRREAKIPWVPVIGLAGGFMTFIFTIGGLLTAQIQDTQSRTLEAIAAMQTVIQENRVDSNVASSLARENARELERLGIVVGQISETSWTSEDHDRYSNITESRDDLVQESLQRQIDSLEEDIRQLRESYREHVNHTLTN